MKRLLMLTSLCAMLAACGGKTGKEDKSLAPIPAADSTATLQDTWSARVGSDFDRPFAHMTLASGPDAVFAASPDGRVNAFNPATGKSLWQVRLKKEQLSAGVSYGEGLVLVANQRGQIVTLNASDGTEAWRADINREVLTAPQVSRGIVVVRSADGQLVGLASENGEQRWKIERSVPTLTLHGTSAPLLVGDVVIAGFASGRLLAASLKTGEALWEIPVGQPSGKDEIDQLTDIDTRPLIAGGLLYVASYQGEVTALNTREGRDLWRHKLSTFRPMAAAGGLIYVTRDDGVLYALDGRTGDVVWHADWLAGRSATGPLVTGGSVAIGDADGTVYLLDGAAGTLQSSLHLGGKGIMTLMGSDSGRFYALTAKGALVAVGVTAG